MYETYFLEGFIHMWRMLVIELMSPRNDQSHQDDLVDDFSCNCVGALWIDKIEDDRVTQNWCQRWRNDQEGNRNCFCSQLTRWPQCDQDHDEVNTMQLEQAYDARPWRKIKLTIDKVQYKSRWQSRMVKLVHNAGKETVMIYVTIRETLQSYFADLARKGGRASNT